MVSMIGHRRDSRLAVGPLTIAATGCRICHCSMTQYIITYCTAGWEHLRKIFSKQLSKPLFMIRSWPCLMGTPLQAPFALPPLPRPPPAAHISSCIKTPCCTHTLHPPPPKLLPTPLLPPLCCCSQTSCWPQPPAAHPTPIIYAMQPHIIFNYPCFPKVLRKRHHSL